MARTHRVPDRYDCFPLGHRGLESGANWVDEADHFGRRPSRNKLAYRLRFPLTNWELLRWSAPALGDIITFYSPLDSELLIKQVIGIPGDQIAPQTTHSS